MMNVRGRDFLEITKYSSYSKIHFSHLYFCGPDIQHNYMSFKNQAK